MEYGTSEGLGSITNEYKTHVTSHFIFLSNLTPDTTYYFKVTSTDIHGQRVVSSILHFKTAKLGSIRRNFIPITTKNRFYSSATIGFTDIKGIGVIVWNSPFDPP